MLQRLPDHLVNFVANNSGHTHVVYKRAAEQRSTSPTTSSRENITYACSVEGSIPPSYENTSSSYFNSTKRGESIDQQRTRYVIEGFVVTDSGLYEKHGRDAKKLTRYVATLMNLVKFLS